MREQVSQFLSPLILQAGLGWYYKKSTDFRVNLSPVTGRAIIVSKKYTENLAEGKKYFGVDAQKSSKLFFWSFDYWLLQKRDNEKYYLGK